MKKDKNYMVCPYCGGRLKWSNTDMATDLCEEYREDDVAVVDYYNCECCGRRYEIFEPKEEERDTDYAKYWNGGHD